MGLAFLTPFRAPREAWRAKEEANMLCSKSCRKKMVCWQLHSPIAEDTARKGLVITVFFFLVNSI